MLRGQNEVPRRSNISEDSKAQPKTSHRFPVADQSNAVQDSRSATRYSLSHVCVYGNVLAFDISV